MRIAIIGHKRIPSNEGGIEKGVEQHAVRMASLGHQVTVYNRGGHNVFGTQYDNKKRRYYKGVRIVTIPTTKGKACVPIYSFLATIHAAIKRYDCVSYRASGSCVMIPLAKLFRLRVVASLHGIDSQRDKWGGFASRYLEFGERMAAKKADVCLVLSSNMQRYIKEKYGTDRSTYMVSHVINIIACDNDSKLIGLVYQLLQAETDFFVNVDRQTSICTVVITDNNLNIDVVTSLIKGLAGALGNHRIICNGIVTNSMDNLDDAIKTMMFLSSKYGNIMTGEVIKVLENNDE